MISLLTFFPALCALVILLVPPHYLRAVRFIALVGTLFPLLLVIQILRQFNPSGGLQFVEHFSWIPSFGVDYFVGIDGISVLLVLLTALIAPLAILASWKKFHQKKSYFCLLLLQFTGLFGAFTALNFFHWFLFWEMSLIPAFFLIKLFGNERRHDAALSFFLFTAAGSMTMLLGFQYLYLKTGTMNFPELAIIAHNGGLVSALGLSYRWIFLAILLGFWVKVPLIPLHVWQPEAYTQAPTPVSAILSALLSKLGVYGFFRIVLPLFPEAIKTYAYPLLTLALLTSFLGVFAALRQGDLKRLLAYSSLAHVGYCLFALFAAATFVNNQGQTFAFQGAMLQMFSHGLTIAGLFFLIGMLEERTSSRFLDDFGGLQKILPRYKMFFFIFIFSTLGLPFLGGFVSEFLIFCGTFSSAPIYTALMTITLFTTALYGLRILQKLFTGALPVKWHAIPDLTALEWITVSPLAILLFAVGIYPAPWLRWSEIALQLLLMNYR